MRTRALTSPTLPARGEFKGDEMPKYKIYAILALLIMTVAFTIPTLGFQSPRQNRIGAG